MADYPQDCIQYSVPEWWKADDNKSLCRGALIEAYVQFYSQVPLALEPQRLEPENHRQASLMAKPLYPKFIVDDASSFVQEEQCALPNPTKLEASSTLGRAICFRWYSRRLVRGGRLR